ncbi:MAG: hypothetical protein IJ045_07600 [Ruminiclostridium sp.]|nr:hypothetical protein [Ruminiclostridium sp.]
MKQKIPSFVFLSLFLISGIVLAIVQDIRYQKAEFWLFAIISSLVITLSLVGIIFVFRKHSFKTFLLITVLSNVAVCVFHSFKQAPDTWSEGTFSAVMERFFYQLPCNFIIAVGVSALCIIGYKLITYFARQKA